MLERCQSRSNTNIPRLDLLLDIMFVPCNIFLSCGCAAAPIPDLEQPEGEKVRRRSLIFWFLTISLLFSACGRENRDISSPEKALLGHWVTREGALRVDYYFGDGTFVLTVGDARLDWNYSVVESDNKKNSIAIEIDMGFTDSAGYKVPTGMVLEFSRNKKSITETAEGPAGRISNKWKYVDSKTEP